MRAFKSPQSPILLRAVQREQNEPTSTSDASHMSSLDPLLGDSNGVDDARENTWGQAPSKIRSRGRRKGSCSDSNEKLKFRRRLGMRPILLVALAGLIVLGFIQLLSLIASVIGLFIPDGIHRILGQWGQPGHIGAGLSSYPTDFTRDILPIPCHSHNDYWRTVPLFSAIEAGCIGVEADVWLFAEKLYVGHDIPSLTPNRTLNNLYINPLLDVLSRQNPKPLVIPDPDTSLNGVFDTEPSQSLILLIDFKTDGRALWPYMYEALDPLRQKGYLTYANGTELIHRPITVVGTGNTPFAMVTSDITNPRHDVFFDAPLEKLVESSTTDTNSTYTTLNSFYASVAITKALGPVINGEFTTHQLSLLRAQVKGAHDRGLKARYWELPFWPIGMRNQVWNTLVREGVDLLNVDDLKGASTMDWGVHWGWWSAKRDVGSREVEEGEGVEQR